MLIIDLNKKYDNLIVQDNWKNGKLPHFSAIVIGDGRVVAMGEQTFKDDNSYESYIYPIVESTISSFMEFSGDFVAITVMVNRAYIPEIDCHVICGEGQMGNEGFVALVKGEILIWSAFFTISNPFYEVKRIGNVIIAKSTHDIFWEFPIFEPWKAHVLESHFRDWPH